MTLDANDYRINVEVIGQLTEDLTEEQRLEFIGNLAIITGVPIIVVCTYLGEAYGFTDALRARQARLMDFYNVTEVLNEIHKPRRMSEDEIQKFIDENRELMEDLGK